jgi:chloride channel protein, CIC family
LALFRVSSVMRHPNHPRAADPVRAREVLNEGFYVTPEATLEAAMPLFERAPVDYIPVARFGTGDAAPEIIGALFHVDALKAYNRALAATAAEEHS